MIPRPPRATRTDTLFPYTTLFRSPKRTALLEAAATAAVALCLDERVGFTEDGEPGPWHEDYSAWVGARIRKVSRRARGAQWLAAQEVPGITVDVDGAQARALVPGTVGELAPPIKQLQIGGEHGRGHVRT